MTPTDKMDAEIPLVNHLGPFHQYLPVITPVLLVSVGYVDPGKWAATVEGGAQFGFDPLALLLFNFAAILCQYLSACIGAVTGRNLGQICSDEYNKCTCIFIGIQAELSVILLDLTMIVGLSHGLNLLFGWDLFTCVLLTAVNAGLFPLYSTLLENFKTKFIITCISGFVLLLFVLGVLTSQPEIPSSMNGMLSKLSGESVFALISLLGASVMPHNFYLHSSMVQAQPNISKDALCYNHLVATICVFSGICLVNYVLMNSSAHVFSTSGFVLLTFQDAFSLLEQVLRSSVVPIAFLFISNQIAVLTWSMGGEVVLRDLLKLEIPIWLHCVTIRIIAVIPALYCSWSSGTEGMYQLLLCVQVMVALLLPSSVIPLFRIATSRPIMGTYKVSQLAEFSSGIIFVGMVGLKIIFVVEMVFGNSDWASNLRWNMCGNLSIPYIGFLMTACSSFCLMIWLAATPLKSASVQLDPQILNLDFSNALPDLSTEKVEVYRGEIKYSGATPELESSPALGEASDNYSGMSVEKYDHGLPENIMGPDQETQLTAIEENCSYSTFLSAPTYSMEESTFTEESVPASSVTSEVPSSTLQEIGALKTESTEPLEKTVGIEGELQSEKYDDEGDNWEPEESLNGISGNASSLSYEGPGSFKSLGGRSEEGGSGAGSLSRLAGLGRAARRQLAAVLDEFWGQLYDFHGHITQDAMSKYLDAVLGMDSSKPASSSLKLDSTRKEFPKYLSSPVGSRVSDSLLTSCIYDSPKPQGVQSGLQASYGMQSGSPSLWSNHIQLLDTYVQNPSRSLPSSESWDYQPATVHGYQIASYLNRMSNKDRGYDNLNGQGGSSSMLESQSVGGAMYRDSVAFALGRKLQNGLGTEYAYGLQNQAVSRNSAMQPERPYYDLCSSGAAENLISVANTKKYHSLPDVHREFHASDKSAQWDGPIGNGSSFGRTGYGLSSYSTSNSRTTAPLPFDELSPSQVYSNALTSHMDSNLGSGSLWTKQPFEQFGLADKSQHIGSKGGISVPSFANQEASYAVDSETWLLQSFRNCIIKLLKLEGSDWLFTQNDGADEELIGSVAARERFHSEAETRQMSEPLYLTSDRKSGSGMKNSESGFMESHIFSVPHCGEGCVWKSDLIISFGVWCIHRILNLSLMESRPELWGKYTYVLNRLQGVIDLAFLKPRKPMSPCFCLQIPTAYQALQRSSPTISNGLLPPASRPGKGKCTTALTLLDIVKDVEIAISCRKGRTGTAAGDVAFPKGKENLASVLKRYKRRLSKFQTH